MAEAFNPPTQEMLIQAHNEQRAMERYGVRLTDHDAENMSAQCRDQRGTFLARKGKHLKIWLVWWPSAERIVPVYYSNKKRAIVTVLPRHAADRVIQRAHVAVSETDLDVLSPSPVVPTLAQGDET